MFFSKKLKFYVVKTSSGSLACCSQTGAPLISDEKEKLVKLLEAIKVKDSRYRDCKILRVSETWG